MKKIIVLVLACLNLVGVNASLNFGSRDAAIEVSTGGAFSVSEADAQLTNGTLRETGDGTGSISGTFIATDMVVDTKADTTTSTYKTDGTVVMGTSIGLGDNQRLLVDGGNVGETVIAGGADADPSIVQGHGSFSSDIAVTDNKELVMRWQGPLNVDIDMGAAGDGETGKVTLAHDLGFIGGKCIKGGTISGETPGTNTVYFAGHRMSFAGSTTMGTNAITFDQADIDLKGDLTINTATVTLSTSAKINGHGNSMTSASSGALSGACTINDAKILDTTVLGGTGTYTLNNVTIDEGSNRARVIEGTLTGGNTGFAAGATTFGASSQVELLSNYAPGGAWTLGSGTQIHGNSYKLNLSSNGLTTSGGATLTDCYLDNLTTNTSLISDADDVWTLTNVTMADDTATPQMLRVVQGTLIENDAEPAGGTAYDADPFGADIKWGASNIELLTDVAPAESWTLTGALDLVGNGKKLSFAGANAALVAGSQAVTITDGHLTAIGSKVSGTGTWTLNNTIVENGTNKIRVAGSLTTSTFNPFAQNTSWNASELTLLSNITPTATWTTLATGTVVNGNGHFVNCGGSGKRVDLDHTVTLNNISLLNVVAATIDRAASADLNLTNVKWYDGSAGSTAGAVHIHGAYETPGAAVVSLTTDAAAGSLFGSATLTTTFSSAGVKMSLLDNCTLGGKWVFGGLSVIDGAGFALDMRSDSAIFDLNDEVTLSNITLNEVHENSFDTAGSAVLNLTNVDWVGTDASGGSVVGGLRINGSRVGVGSTSNDLEPAKLTLATGATAGDIFSDSVTWGAANKGVSLELIANTTISGSSTWTFSGQSSINGHGHVLNIGAGSIDFDDHLTLTDITLTEVAAGSFAAAANKNLYLSNVTWVDDGTEGAITIKASTEAATAATATVNLADTNSGNIFNTAVGFTNGANIELHKNLTFGASAAWTFSDTSVINGNGNVIDVSAASNAIDVATGKTLYINNAVIKGWDNSADITFAGATLALSNVTIIMDADITLGATENFTVNGPLTIVTGEHKFTAHASATNQINGVTVWYDVLDSVDDDNVTISSYTGGGQIKLVGSGGAGSGATSFSSSNTYVDDSLFLDYDINDGALQASGTQITLTNASAFTLLGCGRTFHMGKTATDSTGYLINVSGTGDDGIVKIRDLTIDGWAQAHIQDNSKLKYGDGSLIRLTENQALTTTIFLGDGADSESVTFDLNGHDLDMSNASALLSIAEATTTGGTFTIKNGRIINLSGSKILVESSGTKAETIFEDVEFVLSGATTFADSKFTFKGNCILTGTAAATLTCANTPLKVEDGAVLTIGNGMTLHLLGDALDVKPNPTVTLDTAKSTIFFDGGNLTMADLTGDALSIVTGTIKVDNIAEFGIGASQTLTLGHADTPISIDLQPASSIKITSGTLAYANEAGE